jgi:hypothetical protein
MEKQIGKYTEPITRALIINNMEKLGVIQEISYMKDKYSCSFNKENTIFMYTNMEMKNRPEVHSTKGKGFSKFMSELDNMNEDESWEENFDKMFAMFPIENPFDFVMNWNKKGFLSVDLLSTVILYFLDCNISDVIVKAVPYQTGQIFHISGKSYNFELNAIIAGLGDSIKDDEL